MFIKIGNPTGSLKDSVLLIPDPSVSSIIFLNAYPPYNPNLTFLLVLLYQPSFASARTFSLNLLDFIIRTKFRFRPFPCIPDN